MNILVLDACRDNPFGGTASGKGLAQLDAPPGTFLAFATAPGNVAEDGDAKDGNGLYTRFLLEELKKPEASIENVFKRVRLHVRKQSQGRQVPWESTSLEEDFFFNTGKVIPATMPALGFNTSNLTAMAQPASEIREASFTIEKVDWDKIRDSKNPDDFYAYLQKYPSGRISELAQSRLERVAAARIQMVPDQSGDVQTMAAVRYRAGDRIDFVIKDGLTGVVMRRGQAEIKRVSEDEFDTLGLGPVPLRVNSAGFVLRDPSGQYDPPWPTAPGGVFQIGKKWSSRSIVTQPNGNKTWVDIDARIAAREKVTVPMGSFDTYRVDYQFIWQNGSHTKTTFWYHPDIGYALKMVRESRDNRGALDIQVREMAAYQPAGR